MLTLLTVTGMRQEAWGICLKLMERQSYQGFVKWVIVDDGETPQETTFKRGSWELTIIRREPFWKEGENTQRVNLLTGMNYISDNEKVVIIEDDDYYPENWLKTISDKLDSYDLVGDAPAKYYNVKTGRGRALDNLKHSSLCSTGMKGSAIAEFRKLLRIKQTFIDIELWRKCKNKHLFSDGGVVGIKGLPGRGGIGGGHKASFGEQDARLLESWIGQDIEIYSEFL